MPKKTDHNKARVELAKLATESLQAITVRLPAGLLMRVHQWAEQRGLDLASAIRDLTTKGLEAVIHPGPTSVASRQVVKRWDKPVERALRAGNSPFDPFLAAQTDPNPESVAAILRAILAKVNLQNIYKQVQRKQEEQPWVERYWTQLKGEAQTHVKPLMAALDALEYRFLARKKQYYAPGPEGEETSMIHWLLSESVMQSLAQSPSDDAEVEAVRQLIAARYLVADNPQQPWNYEWDE